MMKKWLRKDEELVNADTNKQFYNDNEGSFLHHTVLEIRNNSTNLEDTLLQEYYITGAVL